MGSACRGCTASRFRAQSRVSFRVTPSRQGAYNPGGRSTPRHLGVLMKLVAAFVFLACCAFGEDRAVAANFESAACGPRGVKSKDRPIRNTPRRRRRKGRRWYTWLIRRSTTISASTENGLAQTSGARTFFPRDGPSDRWSSGGKHVYRRANSMVMRTQAITVVCVGVQCGTVQAGECRTTIRHYVMTPCRRS